MPCVGCKLPSAWACMQLQRPARPDLKARGMSLEGYSLYHAQPGPCQPAVALNDVGRTAIRCRFATKTGEGLICSTRIREYGCYPYS